MMETDLVVRLRRLSNKVWFLVMPWSRLAQNTVGEQLITCLDSVGANLVEGDGRATEADTLRFFVIARASLRESEYWFAVGSDRNLISQELFKEFVDEQSQLLKMLNAMIQYRERFRTSRGVRESFSSYLPLGDETSSLEPGA